MFAISETSHRLIDCLTVPDIYDEKYPDGSRITRQKSPSPLKEESVVIFEEDDENEEDEYYGQNYDNDDIYYICRGYGSDEDDGEYDEGYDYYDEI